MGKKRQQREAVIANVTELEEQLDSAYATLQELAESLRLEGTARARCGELFGQAQSKLQRAAQRTEQLHDEYEARGTMAADVALKGKACITYMGVQLSALGMELDALAHRSGRGRRPGVHEEGGTRMR